MIDVSDPKNPQQVGLLGLGSFGAIRVSVSDGYAYMADGNGLQVIDVGDPENTQEVGFYNAQYFSATDVSVSGGYAYVANEGALGRRG